MRLRGYRWPMPEITALIPARAGSKRVPKKNIRALCGIPLIAYTVVQAKESGIFDEVVVSTDLAEAGEVALEYGADRVIARPPEIATTTSPDIEWIRHAVERMGTKPDAYALLRPTSPFRTPDMIRLAWQMLQDSPKADSIRAVEPCSQHPYKMWRLKDNWLKPLHPAPEGEHPWHSTQYQWLPEIWVQNSSLEIFWARVLEGDQAQAGNNIMPFFTEGNEGLVIDYERDFRYAEEIASSGVSKQVFAKWAAGYWSVVATAEGLK
jgi:CMP-N,N'-diacetyllegionaminic acid synthase